MLDKNFARALWSALFVLSVAFVASCGGRGSRSKSAAADSGCPAHGTEVPFGKLMNPRFAADYEGCTVRTTATFANANSMVEKNLGDDDSVVFDVFDPQTGEGSVEFVKVAKGASDAVFTLKKGEAVVLTGTPQAWPMGGVKSHYFQASSVAKAAP